MIRFGPASQASSIIAAISQNQKTCLRSKIQAPCSPHALNVLPHWTQFQACTQIGPLACLKWNYSENGSKRKQYSLLDGIHPILLAEPDKLTKMESEKQALECLSISLLSSSLEQDGFWTKGSVPDIYTLLILESLHNLNLGILKILEECILIYISSAPAAAGRRTFQLRTFTLLLIAIRRDGGKETINVYFSKGDISADLNGIYTSKGDTGMMEEDDFDQLNPIFSLVGDFSYITMGESHRHTVTYVHTKFSELRDQLNIKNMKRLIAPSLQT